MTCPTWAFALILALVGALSYFAGQIIELWEHLKTIKMMGDVVDTCQVQLNLTTDLLKSNRDLMTTTIEVNRLMLEALKRVNGYMGTLAHDWEEVESEVESMDNKKDKPKKV